MIEPRTAKGFGAFAWRQVKYGKMEFYRDDMDGNSCWLLQYMKQAMQNNCIMGILPL